MSQEKWLVQGMIRMPGATCDARFKIGNSEFHRMGDLGYFDKTGQLRFLGRKAECVYTGDGPIETERCEPAINQLSCVKKSALVGLGEIPRPRTLSRGRTSSRSRASAREKILFAKKFSRHCNTLFPKFKIERVFFEKQIPVDARHNAKIHQLASPENGLPRVSRKESLGKLI